MDNIRWFLACLMVLLIFWGPPLAAFLILICSSPNYKTSFPIDRRKYPLTWAVLNRRTDSVLYLLKNGVHPDSERSPQTPLGHAVASSDIAMAELLLSHGADPNGHFNEEPYLFAAMDALDARLTELLLKSGADPNLTDKNGVSALYLIEARLEYSQDTATDKTSANNIRELLIGYGANK